MALVATAVGFNQWRIHGTMSDVDADFTNAAAAEKVPLEKGLHTFRMHRVHIVKTGGDATAIDETVISNQGNDDGGADPVVGIKVQARLSPLDDFPTDVDQDLGGATGQCLDSGALWIFPGPDTGTNNAYDVDILLSSGLG